MTKWKNSLGGYSAEVPSLPIPNRVIKLSNADGTACCGRVGSRHFQNLEEQSSGFFVYGCFATILQHTVPREPMYFYYIFFAQMRKISYLCSRKREM